MAPARFPIQERSLMCFDVDARPPELPADLARPRLAGGAGAEILELTSADGTRFSAALAESPEGSATGVVILPDVRGLYRFYIELAERFAQAGHHAIAIDYFARTAGVGERDADFDYWPHVEQSSVENVQADVAAAIAALRERTGAGPVITVGFCFGGLHSFLAATSPELDLAGVVGFYGALDGTRVGAPSPLDHTGDMRRPVLGLFGGADQGISAEQVDAFERGLAAAGVEHEIVTYPGAPHSFFDRKFEEHADACADAWRRVLGFAEHVGARVAS
jgi:carboxymethylenebutenolidase